MIEIPRMPEGTLGLLGAMPEEVRTLAEAMTDVAEHELAGRRYLIGELFGVPAVLAHSRVGKVSAATSVTHLITLFGVSRLVFTGVAGGVAEGVVVGDIVVGSELAQHDMDASPLFPPLEVPLTGRSWFPADKALTEAVAAGAEAWVAEGRPGLDKADDFGHAGVRRGPIVSGDRFVNSHNEVAALRARIPSALAVEMEGAAVAQVCAEHDIPFAVVRLISDTADDHAASHFTESLGTLAGAAAIGVLSRMPTA